MSEINCRLCNDTGWIIKQIDQKEFAQRCSCQMDDLFITKGEKANIPSRFLGTELKCYYPENDNPSQNRAKKIAQKFINDYPAVEKGLLFQGSIGLGKTRFLCSIGFELLKQKNCDVYFIDWNDLVREMRSGEDHSQRDFSTINALVQKLASTELLLFDELGASTVSPWVYDNIYYLFNRRYNHKKITVCATNYYDQPTDGQESLTKRIGNRIRSRLYEMTSLVEITGTDYRQKHE